MSDQQQLWPAGIDVDVQWMRIFTAMLHDGRAAKMGGDGFLTFCILRSRADWDSGEVRMSVDDIAGRLGKSKATTERVLDHLIALGHVRKEKVSHRVVRYLVIDNFPLVNVVGVEPGVEEAPEVGSAATVYRSNSVNDVIKELRQFASTGKLAGSNLTVNLTFINQAETVNVNNLSAGAAAGENSIEMRAIVQRQADELLGKGKPT